MNLSSDSVTLLLREYDTGVGLALRQEASMESHEVSDIVAVQYKSLFRGVQ